jgi:anti-sigma factor RsiW
MNCTRAQTSICAARDAALPPAEAAELSAHLNGCTECRAFKTTLEDGLARWRAETAAVAVPDAELEWRAVRRRIQAESQRGAFGLPEAWLRPLRWAALPLGAAAAAAVIFFASPDRNPAGARGADIASAQPVTVEVPGDASAMVMVDDRSGWVFVVASDPRPRGL